MNNRVNYTMVGLLVLLGLAMIIGFAYWLLKPSAQLETKKYNIYFDESVLGLNLDAPVKYRGIDVGKVSGLRISPNNSQQVEVLVTILATTPIKSTTAAKLTSQGITGLSYINLILGDNNAPALKAKKGQEYPVIATVPSLYDVFEKSLDNVSTKLSTTLSKTEKLLRDENQQQFTILITKTAAFMDKMDRLLDEETIKHFQGSMKNLDALSYKFDEMAPKIDNFIDSSVKWEDDISASFASIMKSYLNISSTMGEIKKAVASGDFNVKDISRDIVPTMNGTFLEMQQLMINLEEILNKYERSPGDILFKQESIKKGPGE